KAEVSGQWKDVKIAPKISITAKALWMVYLLLTFLCFISYLLVVVEPFDAICYTFSTLSTGGFAPSDASMTDKPLGMRIVCAIF
ncbi:potassium transporter, partial [Francisella tularensis subsp. holarctica]|uniref:potassium transporter TrkG n=1 Tax=Francisella tularensis TaxID=263 RepID=UPI002381C61F